MWTVTVWTKLSPVILISRLLLHMRHMYVASIWTSTKNEWNAQNAILSCAFPPSTPHNLITHVLTICHLAKAFGPPIIVTRTP